MENKTLDMMRTFVATIAIAFVVIVSGASALSSFQRNEHINQVVAALGGVIKSCPKDSAKDDVCGTTPFSPSLFMSLWDLSSSFSEKVSNTATSINAWFESGGVYIKTFGFSDNDEYTVTINGTTYKSVFKVEWGDPVSETTPRQETGTSSERVVNPTQGGANRNPINEVSPLGSTSPQVTPGETSPIPNGYFDAKRFQFEQGEYGVTSSFDRSGRRVALKLMTYPFKDTIVIYDTTTQKQIVKWQLGSWSANGELTSDGKLLLTSTQDSNSVQVWQASSGKLLAKYPVNTNGKADFQTWVFPDPTGRMYSVQTYIDSTFRIHNLLTGAKLSQVPFPKLAGSGIWNPKGSTFAMEFLNLSGDKNYIYFYDVIKKKITSKLDLLSTSTKFFDFVFNSNGSHLAAWNDAGLLKVFDLVKKTVVFSKTLSTKLFDLQFTTDGHFLLGTTEGIKGSEHIDKIQAIDTNSGKLFAQFKLPKDTKYSGFKISPDGRSFFISNSLFRTTGLLSDAISKAAKEANTAELTKSTYLKRIDVLCSASKLSALNCLIARSAIQTGTIDQYPALKEFLEGRMGEAAFLKEFNK